MWLTDEWNQQGLYAKAVSDWLLTPAVSTLVATYPEPGLKEQNDAAEVERLAAVKGAMSVDRLDAGLDAERLHYVGTDMFTYYRRDEIDALDARLYEKYLAYTMSICENQNLVGASNHTLDVLRKR